MKKMLKQIAEKLPWHKYPIENCTQIDDNQWGYLIFYKDSSHEFIEDERPTDDEILHQWNYVFEKNKPHD